MRPGKHLKRRLNLKKLTRSVAIHSKIALIVFAGLSVHSCSSPQSSEQRLEESAAKVESKGLMEKESYTKIRTITDKVQAEGRIDPRDLEYVLTLMQTQSVEKGSLSYTHLRAAAAIGLIKTFEPGQKEAIRKASLGLFKSGEANDQRAAIEIAKVLNEREAFDLVVPLTKSKHENIRKHAQDLLESKGISRSG